MKFRSASGMMFLLALIVFTGLQGCRTQTVVGATATVQEGAKSSDGSTSFESYLVYNTASLRQKVVISDVVTRKSDEKTGGLIQTNVMLSSKIKKALNVAYKFMWFDQDGFEIMPDAAAWTPMTLQGLESKTIAGVAPRSNAVSFKVKLSLQ